MKLFLSFLGIAAVIALISAPKGSTFGSKIRRMTLTLVALLALAGVTTMVWHWLDERNAKKIGDGTVTNLTANAGTDDQMTLAQITPGDLYGKWKSTKAFMTFYKNNKVQFKWLNGNEWDGTWEVEHGVLFTRFYVNYSNHNDGYNIFNYNGHYFKFQSTNGGEVFEAYKIN